MLNLLETVRRHCADLEPQLLEMHFRRLTPSYFERYAAADIARHLRLIGALSGIHAVDVEIRPLAARTFEVLVVGLDYAGTLACITGALAAYGFDLDDVQISTYMDQEMGSEPTYFIILLRITGSIPGGSLATFTIELRERLRGAFGHLSQGHFLEAQTIAADTRVSPPDAGQATPHRGGAAPTQRETGYEGLVLGGDFGLQRKLATGGMSEVYLATQVSLNRTVAVKLFHHAGSADDELLARFNREAVVLARFSCAHIVQILAAGTVQDRGGGVLGWMAMEHMAGGDLARWLQQHGTPSVERGVRWFRQALEGLHYAHRHGVLHRDVKPHNLLLTVESDLKVSDFGLLKQAETAVTGLTPRSAVLGTPQYMSPEQAIGEPLDERSDVFSLGTTFFHVFSGRLPFQKHSAAALLIQLTHEQAPRLTEVAAVPVPLAVIIQRMMARARDERYQDVGVVLEDLASYERRGLLQGAEAASFAALAAVLPGKPGSATQSYHPGADEAAAEQTGSHRP